MAAAAIHYPLTGESFGTVKQDEVLPLTEPKTAFPTVPKHDVHAKLNFFKENADGSPPTPQYVNNAGTDTRPLDTREVTIKDVRGEEHLYSLDGNGIQFHPHVSKEKDFADDEHIKSVYYPETEQLLKDVTGASKVFLFDHTIRRTTSQDDTTPATSRRGPVQRVHIDQSYQASLNRVAYHLPDEAEALLKGRVQIINVWRPISTVQRDPLAVADAKSVPDEDLVPVALVYPNRRGETYSVRYNPEHKWKYKSGLTPEEIILIKCFDSKTDGRARRSPHTAFVDPTAEESAPMRESIEVRALVFHPDDQE